MTNKRINLNDPTAWSEFDWSDPVVPEALKKSDATVNRSRSAFFKKDDPTFSKTMSKVATERNQDPEYLESLRTGIAHRDNTYQVECNARPEVQAKISKALKGVPKSAEAKKKYKEVKTNKYGDANYEAAHKAGLAKRDKPFHAGEYGTFPSIAEAARQVEEQGLLNNAYKKFSKWKKESPEEYYFIEQTK
jgi:hypothetical protein